MMFDKMFQNKTPGEIAERFQKSRATGMLLLPVIFLTQQFGPWTRHGDSGPSMRTVVIMQAGAYVFCALVLLALLASGGGFLHGRAVRALLSDEVTRAHRATAYAVGFWMLVLGCATLYVVAMLYPIGVLFALRVLLTLGVISPCVAFAAMERKALRD
jgi:hypothetical protein